MQNYESIRQHSQSFCMGIRLSLSPFLMKPILGIARIRFTGQSTGEYNGDSWELIQRHNELVEL